MSGTTIAIGLIILAAVMLTALVVAQIFNLRWRIERLERHAHRHAEYPALGMCGRDVKPEQCDQGFTDWDDCPVCCH